MKKYLLVLPLVALLAACNTPTEKTVFQKVRGTKVAQEVKEAVLDSFKGYYMTNHIEQKTSTDGVQEPIKTQDTTLLFEVQRYDGNGYISIHGDNFTTDIERDVNKDPEISGESDYPGVVSLHDAYLAFQDNVFSWNANFYAANIGGVLSTPVSEIEGERNYISVFKRIEIEGKVAEGNFTLKLNKPYEYKELEGFTQTFTKIEYVYVAHLLQKFEFESIMTASFSTGETKTLVASISAEVTYSSL